MRNVYIALAAILLIGGCSASEAEAPATTSASGTVASTPATTTSDTAATSTSVDTSESSESVFQLRPGDCYNDVLVDEEYVGEFETLPMVDCDAPHDNEAYASFVFNVEGGMYPGEFAFDDEAIARCGSLFEEYVGSSYEISRLDYLWLFPTAESWADGDRRVDCVLFDYDLNKLTGSMRNSGE
jgi:uncharacterized protein YceK